MCARCEELEDEVAWLKSELGLALSDSEIFAVRKAFDITHGEACLMLALYKARDKVLSKALCMAAMPSPGPSKEDDRDWKMADMIVHKIRKKAGRDLIATSHGHGYQITPEGAARVALALSEADLAAWRALGTRKA